MAIGGSLWLAGCVDTGDFGRARPSVWSHIVLPAAGSVVAAGRGEPVSLAPYTDDENELHHRAWRFIMPAHERSWFERQLAEGVRTRILPVSPHPSDLTAYHRALLSEAFRSPASRYSRLSGDAEADLRLIDPFGAVASRVLAADRARLRGLSFVQDLTEEQVLNAAARVAENRCLIAWVRQELGARAQGYRYALEHLFIAMPQADAAQAERAVRRLEHHRRALEGLPVASLETGVCGSLRGGPESSPPPAGPPDIIVKG